MAKKRVEFVYYSCFNQIKSLNSLYARDNYQKIRTLPQ